MKEPTETAPVNPFEYPMRGGADIRPKPSPPEIESGVSGAFLLFPIFLFFFLLVAVCIFVSVKP